MIDLRNLSVRVIREIRVLKNKEFLLDSNICFYACQNVAHDEGNYSSGVAKQKTRSPLMNSVFVSERAT